VLATVIWGNVGTNVFLTLLCDSVLAGLGAFFFSAVVITLFGEIAPQAYFSRNALRMTARLLPFLIFWRVALFFVARPTAILLDWWLGVEGIAYLHERDVRSLVARAAGSGGDIGSLEATGVQNFLDLDDLAVTEEGEPVDAERQKFTGVRTDSPKCPAERVVQGRGHAIRQSCPPASSKRCTAFFQNRPRRPAEPNRARDARLRCGWEAAALRHGRA
jgi:CBS domain containing-hemolysin-like protein